MLTVHFSIRLEVNESPSWCYNNPRVEHALEFNLPVEMFQGTKFSALVEKEIEKMVKEFPVAEEEYRKEQEEEAKAKEEKNG